MEIGLYFQRPMCRSVAVRTGNSWGLRIRIRSASLEPLISGFLILADRFGLAISGDDRIIVCKKSPSRDREGERFCCSTFLFLLLLLQVARVGDDHVFVDAERDVAVHFDQEGRLLDLFHYAVNTAGRDDLVAFLKAGPELSHLLASLRFGAPHEEIQNQNHQAEHDEERIAAASLRCRCCRLK